ncbi:condensin complex subunit 1-like [Ctenocephalides felis]|uniref:condensin complex subunit 1-like n=1 Tax=Ctenocephalides felis TaxID=7515 RepID=UPI000E6E4BC5|nr:condensin complex subunit 1-like [Ctenocephalides felis]
MLRNMWTSTASLSRSADKSVTRKYNSEEIFVKIHDLVIHHFNDSTTGSFRQLANGAVAVVYAGADQPHLLMEKLVSAMLHAENKGTLTLDDKMKSWRVSRILHTVGQVANNHIAFLDLNVYSELGRRKEIQQNTRQSTSSETPSVNSNPRASKLQSASRSIRNNQSYKSHMDDDNEDNEYQECINSDDLEANFVNDIMEKELLQEPAAFSYVLPFVKDILEHRNKFDDDDLEVDASGALMSFMCISSEACRQNIQLLMTVLRHSKFPVVKTNIIVGFADLLFRFPTVVEPWELYVFERLKDDNSEVKKIGLKFICQLILTNIMRPKSYISDIALFLVDEDDALKTLAEHFFKEMSTKDQNLYNALPDIISKMTDPAMNLVEAKFQKIMKSILSYISKDRHMDGLVQKLCLRLQIATDTAQICNLAFCLSILNYTLKSIQVLIDNFEIFRTHLNIPEVYTVFKNIVALGNKQSVKPEMKTLCTELDNKIEALLDVNQDKENMEEARRKLTKKPVGKPRKKNRQGSQNMSVTFEDSIATRRSSRSQPPRRQIVDDSSTSDEEEVLRENKRRS